MKIHQIALLASLFGIPACSGGVCPTVVRTAVAAQTKVSEGFRSLDQVKHVAENVPMPEATRKKLGDEVAKAAAVLSEINVILASAISGCNEPNLDDKFDAFNAAWFAIKGILTLFAEEAGYSKYIGSSDVGFSAQAVLVSTKIPDPFFYTTPQ